MVQGLRGRGFPNAGLGAEVGGVRAAEHEHNKLVMMASRSKGRRLLLSWEPWWVEQALRYILSSSEPGWASP